jgi:hypothetical protein
VRLLHPHTIGQIITHPTKITFADMRDMGVRGLLIYCADYKCSHSIAISGDRWPDHVRLSDIEPLFICQAAAPTCGRILIGISRRSMRWAGTIYYFQDMSQIVTTPIAQAATTRIAIEAVAPADDVYDCLFARHRHKIALSLAPSSAPLAYHLHFNPHEQQTRLG